MIEMAQEKKQIPLRLSQQLYEKLAAWAEDDFRSINSQIEYLLTSCVRQREKSGRYVPERFEKQDKEEREGGSASLEE